MKNLKSAVGLTSYFFSLPSAHLLVFGMLIVGFVFGIFIDLGRYGGIDLFIQGSLDGILLLTAPALLSSALIKLLIRKMPFRRIAAVALAGQLIYGFAYSASPILGYFGPFFAELTVLVAAALVFVLWYAIARLIFILKYRSVLFAILQLLVYLVFLVNSKAIAFQGQGFDSLLVKFYASSAVLFSALMVFFYIINAPMKKNFGFSSTDAFSFFVSQWLYHNKELEKAFISVGDRARTIVSVMGFKRANDLVLFTTPYVHFGPFGNLGGSEFSYLLAKKLDGKYNAKTFVFHGTVTHDLNPVSSSELKKILDASSDLIDNANYQKARVSFMAGSHLDANAEVLRFNDSLLVGVTRAPLVTEDINFGIGFSMILQAEKNSDCAMVVDQHNAETGEITSFEPGSPEGFNYLEAIKNTVEKNPPSSPLKIGVSCKTAESTHLGNGGIKVAVFSSNPEYVIVLIDSNGVTPAFRDKMISQVKDIGKKLGRTWEVGIYTTDTHQVNLVRGVLNPLEAEDVITTVVGQAVKEAVEDMQEARFFASRKWFDIDVLGAKQSIEIVSTVNSVVAVAKIVFPLIILGAILVLFALITKV